MGVQDTKEKGRTKPRRGIMTVISKQAMVYFMLHCRTKIRTKALILPYLSKNQETQEPVRLKQVGGLNSDLSSRNEKGNSLPRGPVTVPQYRFPSPAPSSSSRRPGGEGGPSSMEAAVGDSDAQGASFPV